MKIKILYSIEQAGEARGLTVVIDVFRAFSTACYVFANGAKKIIPVDDIELAYKLKRDNPNFILMGERGGRIQPGFDFGNSPADILNVDFTGKTIVQTTSAGTQGLVGANKAEIIITGSFVNAGACVKYVKDRGFQEIFLLSTDPTPGKNEDILCAEYMRSMLQGQDADFSKIVGDLKAGGHADKFLDPENKDHPEADLPLCLTLNKFDFILKVEGRGEGLLYLKKVKV